MGAKQSGKPGGNKQPPSEKPWLKCGEVGTYAQLNKKRAKPKFERDHVPSHAAMNKAAQGSPDMRGASKKQKKCVKDYVKAHALTIAIPKGMHRKHSRTCGSGNNTPEQIKTDSKNLDSAANKDLAKMQGKLNGTACEEAYREAAKEVRAQDHKKLIKDAIDKCLG